ncbi:MAG: aminotransferase class I/II-fold pyridoxal phosphate-dependent enzyme [SAR202 cluster bacterium]|nr:aminotransferase class I/II-fold pyridoxal phosphate-dependent enzyme [SAR202 cluster bacterium]
MQFANRIKQLKPYLFVGISRTIAAKRAQGIDVISFGIGDPDIPTPPHILEALKAGAGKPANHRYPESEGLPEFRKAVTDWYQHRFGVSLDPATQAINLIGAKEGIGHVALCFLDPGDLALVPDPAYPVYGVGTMFAGGDVYPLPLNEENGFLPDLDSIPEDVARKAKVLWINYPNNPTGATATPAFFKKVVAFAKAYEVAILHDACYTEVTYDGYKGVSFLQTPGALDVGMEFHSLSKTYNMTGWRMGAAVGNADMVNALMRVKSNLDSGAPQAIQEMAIEALATPEAWIKQNNAVYQRRRDKVIKALRGIGLAPNEPKAGLYIWVRVPRGYTSASFAQLLLDQRDIVVTPGSGYGEHGEGFVRLSLTIADERLEIGLKRLEGWTIPPPPRTQR